MKNTYIIFLIVLLSTNLCCTQNAKTNSVAHTLSGSLTQIEKDQDSNTLKQILDNDVIIYIPDAPPIYSKEVVADLFDFLWKKNNSNSNIQYNITSKSTSGNDIIEKGIYSYLDKNGNTEEIPYTISGYKNGTQFFIKEIIYNNSKKLIIELPKPTGNYNIGQSTHYFNNSIESNRPIAFQIWYPTLQDSKDKIPFQSKNVAEAISSFLRWPSFNNSFTRLMKSNSIKDVSIVPNKKFPLVIYNHGYGGATSVYQTVFEELTSHGYIVVSIGHQDESAFLLKEDDTVIQTCPDNDFYAKRAPEINNRSIGTEQSVILNSNDSYALTEAYKKLVKLSPLHTESVKLWTLDTEIVIKKLEEFNNDNKYLKGSFDFNNMGVFGHSVGGATAGELASTQRFKAGINIDGFQFGNLINTSLKCPFMFISSNEEGDRYLRVSPFANNSEFDTYHTIIKGFSHGSFSDLQLFSPNGVEDIQLQRELTLLFFNKYLKAENINLENKSGDLETLTINKLK